ncbi:MAG TPA: mycothiol synthase [Nocardioidaceae bacterium]|nr:mycothiol synthase [Nocardioidaceae bacterium]
MISSPARVDASQFDWSATSGVAEEVRRTAAAAREADGRDPLNEAAWLSLRHDGLSHADLWTLPGGFLLVARQDDGTADANLVVDPSSRGQGLGRALSTTALDAFTGTEVSAWSHGNHPAAAALATELGFDRVRDLWVMRRALSEPLPPLPAEPDGRSVVRTFEPGRDEEAFLAVNAAAFADHPEQGQLTRADLDQRMAEPWFDPAGFFLAVSTGTGELLGYHWTKTVDGVGEVYVLGIAPAAQGMGLGKLLTLTGLHHLRERGLGEVILYVEADNAPAIAVYSGLGFTHADRDTDVQYLRRPGS